MRKQGAPASAWLMRQARVQAWRVALPIGLGLAVTACQVAVAFLVARILTTLLGFSTGGGWGDLAGAGALMLASAGLGGVQELAQQSAGEHARARIRAALFARMLELGPADPRGVGEKAALLVDRVEALDGFFARWLPAMTLAVLSPALVVALVWRADWVSALVLACLGLLVPVAMALTGIGAARESRRQLDVLGRLAGRFVDRLRGLATLVQFNRAEDEARALGAAAEEFRWRTLRVLRVAFLSSAMLELLSAFTLGYLAWRHGALMVGRGASDPTLSLFVVLMVPAFFAPLRAFSAAYHEAMSARGAAAELAPLLEALPAAGLLLEEVPRRVALVFNEVELRHPDAPKPALSRLTFALAPGEVLMLVGPSGAGKSSVLRLLMGFARPTAGRIAVNGQDVTRLRPSELRRLSAYVGQRAHLFGGTLRENIRLARPEASEAEVIRAAEAARVMAFAAELPQGLDTPVGEGGHGISGGQAQRVALARAFLRDAPLVLLDEPTASLDPGTEAEVMEAIARLCTGRTAIIATHSAALLGLSGRVLELGDRRLADAG
ncbi:thiol reductant ABC exporter subunit CydD [Roseococcus sp. SYP-B2431]|uniref:thiol reductant ABC exporter subunit CydD n=1 Tax=Roseococcus sp. SYP-B2431 TaxID=2496640 RepID=UPI00103CC79E|nr:thiol reductant ABC exporter subunit CydD [Roseococcus sp. SYP-B2431]TCH97119.1 thiol reductant ABC exporter subunit CydD [Roseococcus sp. SYP-B2431]